MFQIDKILNFVSCKVSPKKLLFAGCGVLALIFLPLFASEVISDYKTSLPLGEYSSFEPEGDIRRFAGEVLHYDISFLWFNNAASASVGFYEKDGSYYSYLEARTKGFIGFFTAYRQHIYQTNFEIVDGGKQVRATRFMRKIIEGENIEKSEHFFDYALREHRWHIYKNEEVTESKKELIPTGINFDDVLTAFYNFRNGVYGPVAKGSHYTVKTIPEKGNEEISIHVQNFEEENKIRIEQGRKSGEEFLIDLLVPKIIFKSKSGRLRFWSSRHLIPIESKVKDYILLGDLHAVLNKRETPPKGVPVRPPSISFAPVLE
jgi:hypothetical protein